LFGCGFWRAHQRSKAFHDGALPICQSWRRIARAADRQGRRIASSGTWLFAYAISPTSRPLKPGSTDELHSKQQEAARKEAERALGLRRVGRPVWDGGTFL
jgi:hypothetical protein